MGGKSGPDTPEPIDPMRTAEAQWTLTQRQAELDKAARQEDRAYAAQQEAQKAAQRTSDIDAAYNAARQRATQQASNYGLNDLNSVIESALGLAKSSIPSTATDYSGYFGQSAIDNIFNQEQQNRRRQYENQVRADMPYGFEYTQFGDTADDAVINAILGQQYDDAMRELQGYKSSGTITEPNYNDALARLGNQRSAAESQLQSLGGGVLSGYRGQLSDVGNEALTNARNYTLGDTFDPSYYSSKASNLASGFSSRMEGDIRSALGDTNLFDVGSLVGKSMSGNVTNPTGTTTTGPALPGSSGFSGTAGSSPLLGALADQAKKKKTTDRTTSSEGVF